MTSDPLAEVIGYIDGLTDFAARIKQAASVDEVDKKIQWMVEELDIIMQHLNNTLNATIFKR